MVDIKIPAEFDAESRNRIRAAVLAYGDEFEALYREWQRSEDAQQLQQLLLNYGIPIWRLLSRNN